MKINKLEAAILVGWAECLVGEFNSLGSKKDIKFVLKVFEVYPDFKIRFSDFWERIKNE